ncbi:queuine tRNA-ribosyltransferase [Saprolegnia diclina VS20]|uniref:Queuine tRNA-ribosyltransferase catalytic subunit 1 n=1 Tax=Saprolegnia diclina (strain VS20) TaxID=1156394 RepID=T0QCM8_SAPDV|nr:queuine tRNA-ribosyltransferase [Saprolegnia diclina VS20]EQC35649.1 queuine tRNA-ribosyltransferase [Saprolegnia diclina VS20]|eukprot:XP_008610966.1 queuine tRNA-ribosyltransferase [Saprolegnia diclina VS20]
MWRPLAANRARSVVHLSTAATSADGVTSIKKIKKVRFKKDHDYGPPPEASTFPPYVPRDFFRFEVLHESTKSRARVGRIHTPHGVIDTPGFVPVGTNAALKGVTQREADAAGVQLMFANSYHLLLQPGPDVIGGAGGLHTYMNRTRPLITDSGGFQVFSLAYGSVHEELTMKGAGRSHGGKYREGPSTVAKISEDGVDFKSYRDGRKVTLTPESSVQIQKAYGADIIIPFDELPPYHITPEALALSVKRTHRWEARSLREHLKNVKNQAMYGVIHGGVDYDLRKQSIEYIASLPFDGHAIGGSIGKNRDEMLDLLTYVAPQLPREKPIHLLGIADEPSLHGCVPLGIDTFDSCYPTRAGRHGTVFSKTLGRIQVTKGKFASHHGPIDESCRCPACKEHSVSYIHHLFKAHEPTGMMLATLHNLYYMTSLMERFRSDILANKI